MTSLVMVMGGPACAFLIAYATVIRWGAKHHGVWPGTPSYLLAAAAGAVISLSGQVVALQLAPIAADWASPDYYDDAAAASTYLGISLLWPVGWCLLAVVIQLAARRRLGRPARSVGAALAVGLLASLFMFVVLFNYQGALPIWLQVSFLLALLAVAILFLVMAPRRSRDLGLDRETG